MHKEVCIDFSIFVKNNTTIDSKIGRTSGEAKLFDEGTAALPQQACKQCGKMINFCSPLLSPLIFAPPLVVVFTLWLTIRGRSV